MRPTLHIQPFRINDVATISQVPWSADGHVGTAALGCPAGQSPASRVVEDAKTALNSARRGKTAVANSSPEGAACESPARQCRVRVGDGPSPVGTAQTTASPTAAPSDTQVPAQAKAPLPPRVWTRRAERRTALARDCRASRWRSPRPGRAACPCGG
jgi:hypothetical protein